MEKQEAPIDPKVEELLEHLYVTQVEGRQRPAADVPPEAAGLAVAAGLVAPIESDYRLSPAGLLAAGDVVRRHRLAECLLRDVLGVSGGEMHADACQFEHIIRHGLAERICSLLGHPAACPHGRPIPPGPCCQQARADQFPDVTPLSEGKVGVEGAVAYLQTRDTRELQKLMALGVLPGTHVKLIRRFPSYVFQLGYSQFTVDRELASKICVRWASS